MRAFVLCVLTITAACSDGRTLPAERPASFQLDLEFAHMMSSRPHHFELRRHLLTLRDESVIERPLTDAELDQIYAEAREVSKRTTRPRPQLVLHQPSVKLLLSAGGARYVVDSRRSDPGADVMGLVTTLGQLVVTRALAPVELPATRPADFRAYLMRQISNERSEYLEVRDGRLRVDGAEHDVRLAELDALYAAARALAATSLTLDPIRGHDDHHFFLVIDAGRQRRIVQGNLATRSPAERAELDALVAMMTALAARTAP